MANNQTPEKQSAFKELVLPVIVLVVICLVTTVVTFAATAWSIRLTLRLLERRKNRV